MKKLFVILGFFVVMMGFAVWEIVATTHFYEETVRLLDVLEESFETYAELDAPETLSDLENLERHWASGRKLILTFGNHTVVRNADERMTALGEFTRQNERSDAMVSLRQAQRYIRDMMGDLSPALHNLL